MSVTNNHTVVLRSPDLSPQVLCSLWSNRVQRCSLQIGICPKSFISFKCINQTLVIKFSVCYSSKRPSKFSCLLNSSMFRVLSIAPSVKRAYEIKASVKGEVRNLCDTRNQIAVYLSSLTGPNITALAQPMVWVWGRTTCHYFCNSFQSLLLQKLHTSPLNKHICSSVQFENHAEKNPSTASYISPGQCVY